MKAAVLHGAGDIRYEEIETPEPAAKQVRIRVIAAGICGSDYPRILDGTAHYFPIVLGHEFSGRVDAVGEAVTDLKPGDSVVAIPLIPCGTCDACKAGLYSLCSNYSFVGSRQQGGFAEYVVLPRENVRKMRPEANLPKAALLEPATVALHGIRRSNFQKGGSAAVVGGGTVGTFVTEWLRILGASAISVIGRDYQRLAMNQRVGADAVFSTCEEGALEKALAASSENPSEWNSDNGQGYDFVYEAGGTAETVRMALKLAKRRGAVCLLGTLNGELHLSKMEWEQILRKELIIVGSWMSGGLPYPGEDWTRAVQEYEKGNLTVDDGMISTVIPLSEVQNLPTVLQDQNRPKGRIILDCTR